MVRKSKEERGFSVLLEQVQYEQKVLIEKVQALGQKLDRVEQASEGRDSSVDRKLDLYASTLNQRIEQVGAAVTELSAKIETGSVLLTKDV